MNKPPTKNGSGEASPMDVERLGPESDYAAFVKEGVGEELQRVALRKLFSLPEFNVRDGLDDYDADYRSFHPLGDLVPSAPRRRLPEGEDQPTKAEPTGRDATPGPRGRSARSDPPAPTEAPAPGEVVQYVSHGRLLIVGPTEPVEEAACRLPEALSGCLLLGSPGGPAGPPGRWTRTQGRLTRLEGFLGQFRAWAEADGDEADLAARAGMDQFDLVLDLQEPPEMEGPFLPAGYFGPAGDRAALDRALLELPELVGEIERPRFIWFCEERCAHGRGRVRGCSRCLDVCPSGALSDGEGRIRLDPQRCRDCGACATACASGALRNGAPGLGRLRAELGALLGDDASVPGPGIVLRGEGDGETARSPEGPWTNFSMESVWAAGVELWLAALAGGAAAVRIAPPPRAPVRLAGELSRQIALGQALLAGLGYPEEVLEFWGNGSAGASRPPRRASAPVRFDGVWDIGDPRGTLRRALDALRLPDAEVPEAVELPAGAPFGEVLLASERCTLCMACAGVCPSSALSAGAGQPQLRFREAACVQCGLCVSACPEHALTLHGRYHFRAQREGVERTVQEAQPFGCLRCGKPFSTKKMVDRIAEKLLGHWMFPDEAALRRVRMCRDCRIADMLEEQEREGRPSPPT